MKRKKYFGSNLKMYKNVAQTESYLKELADRTRELCMQNPDMELFILPSYTSLETASKVRISPKSILVHRICAGRMKVSLPVRFLRLC